MILGDLSPAARHLFFRLRNHVIGKPERACSCCGQGKWRCGRAPSGCRVTGQDQWQVRRRRSHQVS